MSQPRTCRGCAVSLEGEHAKRKWCSDRCRKRTLYSGTCIDCGARTDGTASGLARAAQRCAPCSVRYRHESRYWTRERIVAAIQRAANDNGGIPPSAALWLLGGKPDYAPTVTTVQAEFGSWSAAITAASFAAYAQGCYGRDGEDPELCSEIRARYEAGERTGELAADYDCTPDAIRYRVRKAGGTIRSLSEALTLRWAA